MTTTIEITDDCINDIVKQELMQMIQCLDKGTKLYKACERMIAFYMTWPETVEHFGEAKAQKLWCKV